MSTFIPCNNAKQRSSITISSSKSLQIYTHDVLLIEVNFIINFNMTPMG